ncbi:hypothetical protein BGX29_002628, partial [Mortierella sp. GBA35]
GEFGKVTKVLNVDCEPFAVKEAKGEGRRLIAKERHALKETNHPHVMKMVDQGIKEGVQFLVLEFCSEGTLDALVQNRHHLTEGEVAILGSQLIEGVLHLHGRGFLHRDLKPENILLDVEDQASQEMVAKIGDLGFAHAYKKKKEATGVWGTPGYIAPEVADMAPHAPKMDVWSIGAILFFMLFGEDPTLGRVKKLLNGEPDEKADEEGIEISKEARDALTAALRLDPAQRASMTELLEKSFFNIPEDAPVLTPANYYHIPGFGPMPLPTLTKKAAAAKEPAPRSPVPKEPVLKGPAAKRPLPSSADAENKKEEKKAKHQ